MIHIGRISGLSLQGWIKCPLHYSLAISKIAAKNLFEFTRGFIRAIPFDWMVLVLLLPDYPITSFVYAVTRFNLAGEIISLRFLGGV